jgi:hypothetical protein
MSGISGETSDHIRGPSNVADPSMSIISGQRRPACLSGTLSLTETFTKHFQSLEAMISTTTKTAPITLKGVEESAMKIDGSATSFGDWRDDLARDGYVVIKGAIPRERADNYANQMYSWLEGL